VDISKSSSKSLGRTRTRRWKDDISRAQSAPGIEQKLREFLNGKKKAAASLSSTLVRFQKWTVSLETEADTPSPRVPAKASEDKDSDAIEQVAESLIEDVSGIDRRLLSKSLQETLIRCSGFAVDLTQNELRKRVRQFLKRESSAFTMQRFLSSYFFNFIWFQTGESFRTRAWTTAEFENDMESVEAHCDKIVAETWKTCEQTRRPLDVAAARQLTRTLEKRLYSKPSE
jgi:hypothetical protein